VYYGQEAGDCPYQYAEQEFDYGYLHGIFILAQWDVHAILLGAFATDYFSERGFLDGIKAEYLPTAVATNNDTLAHSPRPSIVKGTRSADSPLVTNPDEPQ
jgi:hypothetical protein